MTNPSVKVNQSKSNFLIRRPLWVWCLEFGSSLELGAWSLDSLPRSTLAWSFALPVTRHPSPQNSGLLRATPTIFMKRIETRIPPYGPLLWCLEFGSSLELGAWTLGSSLSPVRVNLTKSQQIPLNTTRSQSIPPVPVVKVTQSQLAAPECLRISVKVNQSKSNFLIRRPLRVWCLEFGPSLELGAWTACHVLRWLGASLCPSLVTRHPSPQNSGLLRATPTIFMKRIETRIPPYGPLLWCLEFGPSLELGAWTLGASLCPSLVTRRRTVDRGLWSPPLDPPPARVQQ